MTRRQPADAGRAGPLPRTRGDDLESDDIELIVDTLHAELTPWVPRYAGLGDEPLVRIAISKGDNPDAQSERETDRMLFDFGFPLTKEDLSERYGRPLPEGEEEVLAGRKKTEASRAGTRENLEDGEGDGSDTEEDDGDDTEDELANASSTAEAERTGERPDQHGFLAAAADQLCRAQLVDYRDELAALARVATTSDPVLARATLRRVSAKLGGRRTLPLASATAWAAVLASSLVNGWAVAEVAEPAQVEIGNDGTSEGARKGWETRRRNGWVPAPKLVTPERADELLEQGFTEMTEKGEPIRFGSELKRKLDDKVTNETDRNARKQRINWARLAVREGEVKNGDRNGSQRTLYGKTFRKGGKHQDIHVIVDTRGGYAWNILITKGNPQSIK